jgi:hypothetical protein
MNAKTVSVDHASTGLKGLVRRFPLAARSLELALVTVLYVAGLLAVDHVTGKAILPVAIYAMFFMPVVLSVGVRLFRSIERRLGHGGHHGIG